MRTRLVVVTKGKGCGEAGAASAAMVVDSCVEEAGTKPRTGVSFILATAVPELEPLLISLLERERR